MIKIFKIFLIFFLFSFVLPCFLNEVEIDEVKIDEENVKSKGYLDVKYYPPKNYKIRKTSNISPKKEHRSIKKIGQDGLEKNKKEFQARKQLELNRLKKEYKILTY